MKGRKLLMIPGPIEFEPEVLQAMSIPTPSHVAPNFIACFGHCLEMMRKVWLCPDGQPFIVAGSGTLAMDLAGANLIEPGDQALVVSSGYFGQRFAHLLRRYGAEGDILEAAPGELVPLEQVEAALAAKNYKLMTFTHVDTSTGVRTDAQALGALGQQYNTLTILDGVCSVAGERIHQQEWGIDVVLTASQKAISVPPGLALLVVSPRAMQAWQQRRSPVGNYYADWHNWLPIMQAYEDRKPAYFGTPAVNLIMALEVSLKQILAEGMEARFKRHAHIAHAFREAMQALAIMMLPAEKAAAANTLTAAFYPEGVDGNQFRAAVSQAGVIIAGGLLADLKSQYFRVGHMGPVNQNDLLATVGAIEAALHHCGYPYDTSAGSKAAKAALLADF
ncbi:MAG: alanine--glyoxylate aminotransferase family protein [Bacteroidetes bacterium]|nr:MAG: alanine--glyoxylate aminotransferase family protein [Bacteroidota bacterium]